MKVLFSFQNNNFSAPQKNKINFGAGLTPKMMQEIHKTDTLKISRKFAQKGINSDFSGNQVIAWCCDKTVGILEQLNQKFHTRIVLPEGIYVRDFADLRVDSHTMPGFCNLQPTRLIKGSDEIIPAKRVFFNTFETIRKTLPEYKELYDWNNVSELADFDYASRNSSTDHFLGNFLHELAHADDLQKLLDKLGGEIVAKKIKLARDPKQTERIKIKYGDRISGICDYALTSPFEALACYRAGIIARVLDAETLIPTKNPFVDTPYENLSLWQRLKRPYYSDEKRPLFEILRDFRDGKFD